ncbi:MAG: hypothetical protein OEY52_00650 [Gammaproteobacteria bacterium]|nr:hypothetical protein [Gammaproteobacteria bacterium]
MIKNCLLIILLLLPSLAGASWVLQQSDDGHWIYGQNPDQHQLVITQQNKKKQIILILSLGYNYQLVPQTAQFTIDDASANIYLLKVIKKRPDSVALQLVLTDLEQDQLINQLVHGLQLQIQFDQQIRADFSLNGFTNTFSDFLIANDIGRLEPLWLQMQGYRKELTCYEIARAMITAMQMRQKGKNQAQVETELSELMSEEASAAIPDIIDQSFSVSSDKLPRIPSTRKYAFFKHCMQQFR